MLVVCIVIVAAYVGDCVTSWDHKALQAGMPSVT